ncbi:MAG: hypothetical protein GY844_27685 [Bradyrhizobium sp.]|nr:hypothetical protein [Bradyrhizobium sp.]
MVKDRLLRELLPYRMQAVATLNLALKLSATLGAAPMNIYADGKLVVEGDLNGFTNPAIEAGLMHCRALLEFLGLCSRNRRLGNITNRRNTDVGIEHFNTPDGALKKVTPVDVIGRYPGPAEEAEMALLTVFHVTNKGLAHVTEDLLENPEHGPLIEVASRGIPVLMIGCFYKPLGLPAPDYKLTTRSRNGEDWKCQH